jgi:hypothetical protein
MSGSEEEPVAPEEAASQMQEATERLRNKAWMVAPMTNGAVTTAIEEMSAKETSAKEARAKAASAKDAPDRDAPDRDASDREASGREGDA